MVSDCELQKLDLARIKTSVVLGSSAGMQFWYCSFLMFFITCSASLFLHMISVRFLQDVKFLLFCDSYYVYVDECNEKYPGLQSYIEILEWKILHPR